MSRYSVLFIRKCDDVLHSFADEFRRGAGLLLDEVCGGSILESWAVAGLLVVAFPPQILVLRFIGALR